MKTSVRGWLATVLASGLVAACSSPGGNTNPGTDAGVVSDMGGGTDGGGVTDASGLDGPASDRPPVADRGPTVDRGPVTMMNACAAPADLSTMTPGADGAIHVRGNNETGSAQTLGTLGLVAMGGCINANGGTKGLVNVYRYTMRSAGRLVASTANAGTDDPAFDTIVAILPTCAAAVRPLACNDDSGAAGGMGHNLHSIATTAALMMGQTVFIVVGGYGAAADTASTGNYELTVREAAAIAVGMPCRVGDACVTDATCVGAAAMNSGVCTANGAARTACRTTAPFCNTGLECSVATPSAATAGLCLTSVAPGAACDAFTTCSMMSVCSTLALAPATASDAGAGDAGAPVATRLCRVPVAEVEPNNTPATSQAAVSATTSFRASLPNGDVDCFAVTLAAGTTLFAETHDARGTCSLGMGADTILNVYRQGGTMPLATNDDANGLCSRLDGRTNAMLARLPAGTYNVCVSSFMATGDGGVADGGVNRAIAEYFLTIGLIP